MMFCQASFMATHASSGVFLVAHDGKEEKFSWTPAECFVKRRHSPDSISTPALPPATLPLPSLLAAWKSKNPAQICIAVFSRVRLVQSFLHPRRRHQAEDCWPAA